MKHSMNKDIMNEKKQVNEGGEKPKTISMIRKEIHEVFSIDRDCVHPLPDPQPFFMFTFKKDKLIFGCVNTYFGPPVTPTYQ